MASGDTLFVITPPVANEAETNQATLDVRNGHTVYDFDASTNEFLITKHIMPAHYSGGGIDVIIQYAMSTATSGDVDLDVALERVGDQVLDIDTDSFGSNTSADDNTVPATSGLTDYVTVSLTDGANMDNVAAGEGFRLRIQRDATNDTAAGDMELWGVHVKET